MSTDFKFNGKVTKLKRPYHEMVTIKDGNERVAYIIGDTRDRSQPAVLRLVSAETFKQLVKDNQVQLLGLKGDSIVYSPDEIEKKLFEKPKYKDSYENYWAYDMQIRQRDILVSVENINYFGGGISKPVLLLGQLFIGFMEIGPLANMKSLYAKQIHCRMSSSAKLAKVTVDADTEIGKAGVRELILNHHLELVSLFSQQYPMSQERGYGYLVNSHFANKQEATAMFKRRDFYNCYPLKYWYTNSSDMRKISKKGAVYLDEFMDTLNLL